MVGQGKRKEVETVWVSVYRSFKTFGLQINMGASYNGSTSVSKTECVGSIPTAPANV